MTADQKPMPREIWAGISPLESYHQTWCVEEEKLKDDVKYIRADLATALETQGLREKLAIARRALEQVKEFPYSEIAQQALMEIGE